MLNANTMEYNGPVVLNLIETNHTSHPIPWWSYFLNLSSNNMSTNQQGYTVWDMSYGKSIKTKKKKSIGIK